MTVYALALLADSTNFIEAGKGENNFEADLQKAKELCHDDLNFKEALPLLEKLHKEQPENKEVWVYLLAASARLNRTQPPSLREKLNRWFDSHPQKPQALILKITYKHLQSRHHDALEIAKGIINNRKGLEGFSSLEKKTLFWLAGGSYFFTLPLYRSELEETVEYLKAALNIKCKNKNKKPADFVDYHCYYQLGLTYKHLAIHTEDEKYYDQAFSAFKKALSLRPKAKRPCEEWRELNREIKPVRNVPQNCLPQ